MTDVVRAPASSANLGCGFDVLGMAIDLYADVGVGPAPDGAQQLDAHHPALEPYRRLGGRSEQVAVVSYGEERPICTDSDESCWSKNRRAEIVYTAKQ